jgi:hypothetical protein
MAITAARPASIRMRAQDSSRVPCGRGGLRITLPSAASVPSAIAGRPSVSRLIHSSRSGNSGRPIAGANVNPPHHDVDLPRLPATR